MEVKWRTPVLHARRNKRTGEKIFKTERCLECKGDHFSTLISTMIIIENDLENVDIEEAGYMLSHLILCLYTTIYNLMILIVKRTKERTKT